MKKIFLLFALMGIVAIGCSKDEIDKDKDKDNENKTEQPNENEEGDEEDMPESIFFGLDKESVTISPDGGSVDIVVYSNYKWEISGTSDWCTPSVKTGNADEDGQKVTFSADLTYDDREATFWFRCADEKIKLVVSQKLKAVIIPDANNSFNIPADGGIAVISYKTSVDCEVIIPEEAKDWITIVPATRGLVSENINLDVAENTTYDPRSAVIKVVAKDNAELVVEYTFNQEQNNALLTDGNNTFTVPSTGGKVEIKYQTNIDCEVIIPEEAKDWITIVPATRGLVSENINLDIAENTTYDPRSAVIKVVAKDNAELVVEYTINQEQNNALLTDGNNTFTVPSTGGKVEIKYQTNIDCEVIVPEEAKDWITIVPATRGLVSENINLDIAENTTYDPRSAVIKVVAKDNAELVVEYTINQEQNNALLTDENNTFTVQGTGGEVVIYYKTNVDCEVIISEDAQDWITIVPTTRGLVTYNTTLNIAANNSGALRSSVVKVISQDNSEIFAEYTITQKPRYCLYYTSSDGEIVDPRSFSFDATILSNTYKEGVGVIEFDAPITSIGVWAFSQCRSLTSITIPDSVTSIGDSAFSQCSSLTSVTIGDSVTSIGVGTFSQCSSLHSVDIGDSVTSIGDTAFWDCSNLTSITIPDSVTSIGVGTFSQCSSLHSVDIGDSVTSIGDTAFWDCSNLTSITIPDSVTSIGVWAFSQCSSLTSITIPDSVTSIGDSAFMSCSSLTSVVIGNNVTTIGDSAFWCCDNLTSVVIGNNVTTIGDSAFWNCNNLTSVTIPDSVTSIGKFTFMSCNSLTSIYCKPTTPPMGDSFMFSDNASDRMIYVPMESVSEYKSASYWDDYADAIVGYNF